MPAALVLADDDSDVVDSYLAAMRRAGRRTGRSTVQAARTCQARISRAGGWDSLSDIDQIDAVSKARSFGSWLMVTGRVRASAVLVSSLNLHLGNAARQFCPRNNLWFAAVCDGLGTSSTDTAAQWNTLARVAALTGVPPWPW